MKQKQTVPVLYRSSAKLYIKGVLQTLIMVTCSWDSTFLMGLSCRRGHSTHHEGFIDRKFHDLLQILRIVGCRVAHLIV